MAATRKMIQFSVDAEEHKALRIRAIEEDTNLIGLCRAALGLSPQMPGSNGTDEGSDV